MRQLYLAIGAVLALAACEEVWTVRVDIRGVSGDIARVDALSWLNGVADQHNARPLARPNPLDAYVLRVPKAQATGAQPALRLQVIGRGQGGCLIDEAEATQTLHDDVNEYRVEVTLARPHVGCLLRVHKDGAGLVHGGADRPDCGGATCEWHAPEGSAIELVAQPDRSTFHVDYKDAAAPGSGATLRLRSGERSEVTARFFPRHRSPDGFVFERTYPQANTIHGLAAGRSASGARCRTWAVGAEGTLLCFDGRSWDPVPGVPAGSGRLAAAWMDPGGDVWAVGGAWRDAVKREVGTILRLHEGTWSLHTADCSIAKGEWRGPCGRFNAVFGDGHGHLWALGGTALSTTIEVGTMVYFDGATWQPGDIEDDAGVLWGLFSPGKDEFFAVGKRGREIGKGSGGVYHGRGASLRLEQESAEWLNAVWGSGPGDLWAAGFGGAVLRRTQGGWQRVAWTGPKPLQAALYAIAGRGPNDVWFAGERGTILHWDGAALKDSGPVPMTAQGTLRAIWAGAQGNTWMAGEHGVMLFQEGSQWRSLPDVREPTPILNQVWGSDPNNLWVAAGRGTVLHFDGTKWQVEHPSQLGNETLRGIWGSAPDDLWGVGGDTFGVALHRQNGTWRSVGIPTQKVLHAVWGTSASDLWAVGDDNVILRFVPGPPEDRWIKVSLWGGDDTSDLWGLWGSGPQDVYAVGEQGTIAHYDGVAWRVVPHGLVMVNGVEVGGTQLHGVWGSGPDDVWVVGDKGLILHQRLGRWSGEHSVQTTLRPELRCIIGSAADDIWAAGGRGAVWHYDGTGWTQKNSGAAGTLRGMWRAQDGVLWLVGDSGWVLTELAQGITTIDGGTLLRWEARDVQRAR